MIIHRILPLVALSTALVGASAHADVPNDDETPPEITIVEPADGAEIPGDPATIRIVVEASDPGSGVAQVVATVDGTALAAKTSSPYAWDAVELAAGAHSIAVEATNGDGYSGTVTIAVTVVASAGDDGEDASATKAMDDASPNDGGSSDKGGGCTASARPRTLIGSGIAFALALFAGLALRNRKP